MVFVSEVTVFRVVDPALCVIFPLALKDSNVVDPDTTSEVCVPTFVILFCEGVAIVPVSVAPETSPVAVTLRAEMVPVLVIVEAVNPLPVIFALEATIAPVFVVPVVEKLSAVRVPVNTVFPGVDDPIF